MISEKITRVCSMLLVLFPLTLLAGTAVPDVLAIIIGLGFLLHSTLTRQWQWLRSPWVQAAFALYFYIVIRSFFAASPHDALARSAPFLRYFIFAAAIAFWLYSVPNVRRYLPQSLSIAITFLIADMLFQYVTGLDIIGRFSIASDGGSMRLTGPYSAPRAGITLVWLAWPMVAYLLVSAENKMPPYKLLAGCLWGACLIAIFLSGERMATLLAVLASFLLLLLLREARRAALWLVPLAAMSIVELVYFNPSLTVRQVDTTVQAAEHAKESPYGRLWVSSFKIIEDYPVFGVGAKHFRSVCLDDRYGGKEILNCNLHPHQLYLEWWVEEGIVGLFLFLALIYCWGREVWLHMRVSNYQPLFIGLLIGCIVKLFPFSTSVSFFVSWSALPFWLMVGWLMAICNSEESAAPV